MNAELKKIVSRVKTAQTRLQSMLNNQDWPGYMEEARKYAEKQGTEVKKLLSSDLGKVKTFIERERKELERFQKQIPGEVKKFRKLLMQQRKDLEKMLGSIGTLGATSNGKKRKTGSKKGTAKKAGTRKKAAPSA
jgi:antitoxin component HigA of HigAB toxin-antitoxin module